jgi:indolepyruvate ferredoxin oxidoreductase
MKVATNVADATSTLDWRPHLLEPRLPDMSVDGRPFRHRMTARMLQPDLGELERSRDGARLEIARRYAAANRLNVIEGALTGGRIGLVAAGKTYRDLRQALRQLGLDDAELGHRGIRLLNMAMVYPVEPTTVAEFAQGLREIVVVEEKRPFLESEFRNLLYRSADAPIICGKRDPSGTPLLRSDGELDADTIASAIAARVLAHGQVPSVESWLARSRDTGRRPSLPLVARTPYFCSGCPHSSSTKVPEGSVVGAGIGCHALVMNMNSDRVGEVAGLTQMGGEGAQWIGMAPFRERTHFLQNLGDGTFHHSGSLAIRAAVAGSVNVTYKLLVNSVAAMTGGQQLAGGLALPEMIRSLQAEGVNRIIVTSDQPHQYRRNALGRGVDVWHRDRLEQAQHELAAISGVTVLIHDQECATELRRKRKRGLAPQSAQRVLINERLCEGCGDCGRKSNCLSVEPVATEFGRKTPIDQTSCNVDLSCLDGDCPAFITVTNYGQSTDQPAHQLTLDADALPDPTVTHQNRDQHTIRLTGIGGTGVVTLAQILGAAATLDGMHVRTLDQTGLAQKGGAVISDLRLSASPIQGTNKVSVGECDLYLGCDLLVAADQVDLGVANPAHTVSVVSTTQVPTGAMVTDPATHYPDIADVLEQLSAASATCTSLDARAASERWLGSGQFANLLLAGVAYQAGALPISAGSIEKAITATGIRIDDNIQAFRRGRQFIADPASFTAPIAELPPGTPATLAQSAEVLTSSNAAPHHRGTTVGASDHALADILSVRVADLRTYQNDKYAEKYRQSVAAVAAEEQRRQPGSDIIACAFARHLYKLMAYKDEYEVARLSLDPALTAQVQHSFGPDARVSYRLHPPLLRALGLRHKLSLGPWFRPVFAMLMLARRLRGTPLDPFGYAQVRRVERALINEYTQAVTRTLPQLQPSTIDLVLELANLPDMIRGYEDIKLDSVARYRVRLAELEQQLATATSQATHH